MVWSRRAFRLCCPGSEQIQSGMGEAGRFYRVCYVLCDSSTKRESSSLCLHSFNQLLISSSLPSLSAGTQDLGFPGSAGGQSQAVPAGGGGAPLQMCPTPDVQLQLLLPSPGPAWDQEPPAPCASGAGLGLGSVPTASVRCQNGIPKHPRGILPSWWGLELAVTCLSNCCDAH